MGLYQQFRVPDPGEILVREVRDVAGEHAAIAVEGELQRLRRSDGTIVAVDNAATTREKHSPLNSLATLITFEQIALEAWAGLGFGIASRRASVRQAEQIWRTQGLDAAVSWVLANAKHQANVMSLVQLLEDNARTPCGDLEAAFRANLAKDLRKWSPSSARSQAPELAHRIGSAITAAINPPDLGPVTRDASLPGDASARNVSNPKRWLTAAAAGVLLAIGAWTVGSSKSIPNVAAPDTRPPGAQSIPESGDIPGPREGGGTLVGGSSSSRQLPSRVDSRLVPPKNDPDPEFVKVFESSGC